MPQIAVDILRELEHFYLRSVETIAFFFALSPLMAMVIFWLVFAEIVVFVILLPLHRLILRSINKSKQGLVKEVDEVVYLLAKAQYESNISKQEL